MEKSPTYEPKQYTTISFCELNFEVKVLVVPAVGKTAGFCEVAPISLKNVRTTQMALNAVPTKAKKLLDYGDWMIGSTNTASVFNFSGRVRIQRLGCSNKRSIFSWNKSCKDHLQSERAQLDSLPRTEPPV